MSIPKPYKQMKADQPGLMEAYESFGAACAGAGPLDEKTVALVKLCISLGAGMEGSAHSHARKALEAGWSPDELLHAAYMCAPTIGFPNMMRSRGWVLDVTDPGRRTRN
jgi:4-carboxymuconolactone decarboxylase